MDQEHESRVIPVEIHGQRYPIRSALDPRTSRSWRRTSTRRCGSPPNECPAGDTLKLAVLAALNIADEFFRARDDDQRPPGRRSQNRASELERDARSRARAGRSAEAAEPAGRFGSGISTPASRLK